MSRKTAILLCGAGPQVGMGHVARCAALAEALVSEGWNCTIALGSRIEMPLAFRSLPHLEVLQPPHSSWSSEEITDHWPGGADLFVCDQYGLDTSFERSLAGWASKRLVIDDLLVNQHECEALLCIAPPASLPRVISMGATTALTGTHYALLRRQFWRRRVQRLLLGNRATEPMTVLVSLGGTPQSASLKFILAGLANLSLPLKVKLIGANAAEVARDYEGSQLKIEPIAVTTDMDVLLDSVAMAVGACAGSAWERAALGVPSIAFEIADNQRDVAATLRRSGAAIVFPSTDKTEMNEFAQTARDLLVDTERAREMSQRAYRLVDALGSQRVLLHVDPERTKDGGSVNLRPAREEDCRRIYTWQQEPSIRRYSNNPAAPNWSEHEHWVRSRLRDPCCLLSVVVWGNEDAGVLRVDFEQHRDRPAGIVSLYVAPEVSGRGIGTAALRAARRLVPDLPLDAEIDPRNTASLAVFRTAGYKQIDQRWHCSNISPSNE